MRTPEAIERISQEEDHWRTVYFDDSSALKKTIVIDKHEDIGYRFATVEGTDISVLDRLDTLEGKELPRASAMELRRRYDHNWASRDKLKQQAHALYDRGLLRPLGAGALGASLDLSGSRQASGFSLTIQEDGGIATLIHDPVQTDDFNGQVHTMDWHEYELPRHVSYGIHRVQHTERSHSIPKTVYNPLTIVRVVIEWFKVAEATVR